VRDRQLEGAKTEKEVGEIKARPVSPVATSWMQQRAHYNFKLINVQITMVGNDPGWRGLSNDVAKGLEFGGRSLCKVPMSDCPPLIQQHTQLPFLPSL
jgi:hypothetical protein